MKNSMMRRFLVVAASAATLTMFCGGLRLTAQEPKAGSGSTKTAKRDPARRLPQYFGQIGLSESQTEEIYKVQGKHMPRIVALEKQVDDLRAQMLLDCERVLKPEQKKLLDERRAAGAESRAKRRAAAKKSP